MKRKIIFALTSLLLVSSTPLFAQQLKELEAGDPVGSTSDESKAVTEKVRKQIIELNKGILHGAPQFSIVGNAEKSGDAWVINGDKFIINEDTVVHGELKPGAYVEIRGNLEKGKPMIAKQVIVASETTSDLNKKSDDSSGSSGHRKSPVDFPWQDRR